MTKTKTYQYRSLAHSDDEWEEGQATSFLHMAEIAGQEIWDDEGEVDLHNFQDRVTVRRQGVTKIFMVTAYVEIQADELSEE